MLIRMCIQTMLLRIRWHLLEADYNNALGLLLRYPELEKDFPAQTLALDALYLKEHMHPDGGSYCVLKYTGRPLLKLDRPATPVSAFGERVTIRMLTHESSRPSKETLQHSLVALACHHHELFDNHVSKASFRQLLRTFMLRERSWASANKSEMLLTKFRRKRMKFVFRKRLHPHLGVKLA